MAERALSILIDVDDQGAKGKLLDLDRSIGRIQGTAAAATDKGVGPLEQALKRSGSAMSELGQMVGRVVPGVSELTSGMERIGASAPGLASVVIGFGAVAAAAAAAGYAVFNAAAEAGRFAANLENLSRQTGIAVGPLQAIGNVAQQSGVSTEEMANAVGQLSRRLGDRDPTAASWVTKLGVDIDDLMKQKPEEQFLTMAEAIAHVGDQALKDSAKVGLFGRTGLQASAMFQDGIRDLVAEQGRMNTVLGDKSVEALGKYDREVGIVAKQWQIFKTEALIPVLPILETILQKATSVVERLRMIPPASSDGQPIIGPGGGKAITLDQARAAAGGGPMSTQMTLDVAQLGQVHKAAEEVTTALMAAQRQMARLSTEGMQPLSAESQAIAKDMKVWGLSNAEIAKTLEAVEGNTKITEVTVSRYFATLENGRIVTQALGEAAKASAAAQAEGARGALAVAQASHDTQIALIKQQLLDQADKNARLTAEDARYAAETERIRTEESRKIRDYAEKASIARADEAVRALEVRLKVEADGLTAMQSLQDNGLRASILSRSNYHDQVRDLDLTSVAVAERVALDAAQREATTETAFLQEKESIIVAFNARRQQIEEASAARRLQLLNNELAAQRTVLAAMGLSVEGDPVNDPYLKAYRAREVAIARLQTSEQAGIDTSMQQTLIENDYIKALQTADGALAGVADKTNQVTQSTNQATAAVGQLSSALSASADQMRAFMDTPGYDPLSGVGQHVGNLATRAGGGDVNSGTPYLVGEDGPELFTPRSSGRISTSGSGGGDTYNITIQGNVDSDQRVRQLARQINAETTAKSERRSKSSVSRR